MPLSPQPVHLDDHPQPAAASSGFKGWSEQVGDPDSSTRQSRASQPLLPGIDVTHPLFKVAMVAFIGYTFGRLMHRHR